MGRSDEGVRRDVGFSGLLWISAGTTLGSGWLFGAFVAVTIAGPAALVGRVLAALLLAPLALVCAGLGAMFPESGGPGRFAHHARCHADRSVRSATTAPGDACRDQIGTTPSVATSDRVE